MLGQMTCVPGTRSGDPRDREQAGGGIFASGALADEHVPLLRLSAPSAETLQAAVAKGWVSPGVLGVLGAGDEGL